MDAVSLIKLLPDEVCWTLTDVKSTLVHVIAWCRQATSHYLNRCWPCSLSPYGITRPQWVNMPNWHFRILWWWCCGHNIVMSWQCGWHNALFLTIRTPELTLPAIFIQIKAQLWQAYDSENFNVWSQVNLGPHIFWCFLCKIQHVVDL